MVNTRSRLKRETPLKNLNLTLTATMMNNDPLQQLQASITEIERCHEEELRKLKADHDELEAHVRHPQGDEQSALITNEHT